MSQAEKRAKQMQEMGIDASDISDIPAMSSSAAAVKHTHQATVKSAPPPPQNGRTQPPPHAERSNSNTPSLQNAVVIDKKKGILHLHVLSFCSSWIVLYSTYLLRLLMFTCE